MRPLTIILNSLAVLAFACSVWFMNQWRLTHLWEHVTPMWIAMAVAAVFSGAGWMWHGRRMVLLKVVAAMALAVSGVFAYLWHATHVWAYVAPMWVSMVACLLLSGVAGVVSLFVADRTKKSRRTPARSAGYRDEEPTDRPSASTDRDDA